MKAFLGAGRGLLGRRVTRVAAAYGVASWIVIQVAQAVMPAVGLPEWTQTLVVMLALLAFLPTVAVAWVLEREPPASVDSAPVEQLSIAVLPFVNFSPDAANEYFSDGITEELIDRLVKIRELRVAARTSSFAFKGRNEPIAEIGRQLRVAYVLEGSVRRSMERLRVTAQLVDASSGFHLWSETYERSLQDIFAVQDEIGRAIVGALRIELVPAEKSDRRAAEANPTSVHAYDLYLQGRHLLNRRSAGSIRSAIEHFELAVACDALFARAYAGLAECYLVLASGTHAVMPGSIAVVRARAHAERALELEPELAEANIALGLSQLYSWDWSASETRLRRVVELHPGNPAGQHQYAWRLALTANFEGALAAIDRAIELDPLSLPTRVARGRILQFMRRPEQAVAEYRRALVMDESFAGGHLSLGLALLQVGIVGDAVLELERARELSDTPAVMALLAYAYGAAGEAQRGKALLNNLLSASERQYVSPVTIAGAYVGLGCAEEALDWYERAYAERSPGLLYLRVEPLLDPLRGNSRFDALLSGVGLNAASQLMSA